MKKRGPVGKYRERASKQRKESAISNAGKRENRRNNYNNWFLKNYAFGNYLATRCLLIASH